jgi:hypothetical protein
MARVIDGGWRNNLREMSLWTLSGQAVGVGGV